MTFSRITTRSLSAKMKKTLSISHAKILSIPQAATPRVVKSLRISARSFWECRSIGVECFRVESGASWLRAARRGWMTFSRITTRAVRARNPVGTGS